MKVKVTNKSFYDNRINKIGEIIEIKEKDCPSWCEPIDNTEAQTEDNKETKAPDTKADSKIEELSKLKEDEIKEILDNLLDEAINKGIMIEFENKSDIALILELTELLKGKE